MEYIDNVQIVAFTHIKIIGVMSRSNFYTTCSKFHIHIIVCKNGNFSIYNGEENRLSNQICVAIIFRIYRNTGISQHGFRAGGSHYQMTTAITEWIAEMPEVTHSVFVNNLFFRQGCLSLWIPVDNAFTAVNQAVIIKLNKYLHYCF